jgi:hypothetical protein
MLYIKGGCTMDLKPSEVAKILKNKSIHTLYHADSVITSCSFLKKGCLLSRGELETQRLPMTEQISDNKDKEFGLWYDVFVDGIDIHDRIKKRNFYGPVLLCIDASILTEDRITSIRVTRSNPQNWNSNSPEKERYFQTIDEFNYGYQYGDFQKMFVIPNGNGSIRFKEYLRKIVVDYITLNGNQLWERAIDALKATAEESKIDHIQIEKRNCTGECNCIREYQMMRPETLQKFFGLSNN